MWTTIDYRIESAMIEQTSRAYREVWFLDAVQESPDGRRSTSNICSGSKRYCQDMLNEVRSNGGW